MASATECLKMRAWKAEVEVKPWADGGFVAAVPSLQGCWVVAPTPEEAIRDIYEMIEMSIASRIKRGEPLPPDLKEIAPDQGNMRIELAVAVS